MPAPAQTSNEQIVTAARALLERDGPSGLTMAGVAAAVGVRAPSLYKRVRDRDHLLRLVLDGVAAEMATELAAAPEAEDPVDALHRMAGVYRRFAHANPVSYSLLIGPSPGSGDRAHRSSDAVLAVMTAIVGPDDALLAARTVTAWAHGFISMELSGAFQLGGDLEAAWTYGIHAIVSGLARSE